jgi:hypothetical protein
MRSLESRKEEGKKIDEELEKASHLDRLTQAAKELVRFSQNKNDRTYTILL